MLAALLCATAVAAPPPLVDEWWGVELADAGLETVSLVAPPDQILRGRAGGIDAEVYVVEQVVASAAGAMAKSVKGWTDRGRPFGALVRDDDAAIVLLTERGIDNELQRHAYRFVVRGDQTFVAHARTAVDDGESVDDVLRAAVVSLQVDPSGAGCLESLAVKEEVSELGDELPASWVAALTAERYYDRRPPLPQLVSRHVELALSDADLEPDQRLDLHLMAGLAHLTRHRLGDAQDWLGRALLVADETDDAADSRGLVLYNIACAHAVAGEPEAAFETLGRIVDEGTWQNHAEWAQEDPDFESIRDDARWAGLPKPK